MKIDRALLSLLLCLGACGVGDSDTGSEETSDTSTGDGESSTDTGEEDDDGSTSPPMHDMAWDDTGDAETTDTGDAGTGSGVCDEDVFNDCVQTVAAAQDPLDLCSNTLIDCEWSQCYGTYLKMWHVVTVESRMTCMGIYPACVEHANIPFYYCIVDCYEIQETCDDGDICTACTTAGAECFNAC